MATSKSLAALEKSKEAVSVIKERLVPVLQRLTNDQFGDKTNRAKASVALSIGMMRYMGARLRGLDQGRKPNDPLRKDLNNIKRVLAKTMKKAQQPDKKTKIVGRDESSSKVVSVASEESKSSRNETVQSKVEGDQKKEQRDYTERIKRKTDDIKSQKPTSKKARKKR